MLSGRKFSLIIVVMAVFMAITGGAAFLTAYAFGVRDENQLTAMALISFGAALVGFCGICDNRLSGARQNEEGNPGEVWATLT